jgi:hypothetical protein
MTRRERKQEGEVGAADPFSADPNTRAVELAFLGRLLDVSVRRSAVALGATSDLGKQSVTDSLAQVRSGVFEKMARALEKNIPVDADFSLFRSD